MIKLSMDSRIQPIKYILTPDNRLQPVTDIVDSTTDQSPVVYNSLQTINELGKKLLKAASDGIVQEVKTLLSQGSPFTSDWLGTSPLHLAAQNNNVEVCEVLLKGGISKDARNKVDRTPLHLAAYEGHYQVTETLIKHGSDVNCKDMLNMTPLHWAVQNSHTSVVELLLRNGAQTNVSNKFNLTPQDIAHQIDKLEIVELLQAYEGDPQAATQNLIIHLQTEGLDKASEIQENSNSNEMTNQIDPIIINLNDSQFTGLDDGQILPEEPPLDVCEGRDSSNDKDPVIINLLKDVAEDIQDREKDNHIPVLSNNKPVTDFILIDNVIHPVEDGDHFSAEQLLQEHGITMIPNDNEENNLLSIVMESGHSVVLTDIGKEVLNSVKQDEEKISLQCTNSKKVLKLRPEDFFSITNGQPTKNVSTPGKFNVVSMKPNTRRVIMKKNRPTPYSNMIKVQTTINKTNNNKTELEYVMDQLVEARKTIEEYKTKLKNKEMEVERYKIQLKLLMDPS